MALAYMSHCIVLLITMDLKFCDKTNTPDQAIPHIYVNTLHVLYSNLRSLYIPLEVWVWFII